MPNKILFHQVRIYLFPLKVSSHTFNVESDEMFTVIVCLPSYTVALLGVGDV